MGSKSSEFNTNRLYSRLLHSSGKTKCFILIGAVVVVILIAIIYFRPRAKSIVNTQATTTSTTWIPPSTPCPSLSCPPCKSSTCPPCPPSSSLPSTPCPSVPNPSAAPCPNTFKFTCQKTDGDATGTNPAFNSLHDVKLNGATGKTFSGKSTRTYPKSKLKFSSYRVERTHNTGMTVDGPQCDRWAVMTTIFSPDEGVYRQTRLENWCMVIVGDKISPEHFDVDWTAGEGNNAVVYLSPDDQKAMRNPFVDGLLWNHFGRKNVGYLYAITHGAKAIWDFDDDNLLYFYLTGASPEPSLSLDSYVPSSDDQLLEVQELDGHTATTYNPYPYLGAPTLPSWPRGFPLSHVKQPETYNRCAEPARIRHASVAVLQSVANQQPDVDAIFRFVMPIPFNFQRSDATRPLMIPTRVLTPYNGQATLHLKAGFWGLLLPVSVQGRVSDIWRSYFFQRLFWDVGLRVGFMARPFVIQDRNIHRNLADFNAENDLYQKSEQLIDFLQQWEGKSTTLTGRIEELWVALYEHEYIDILDVTIVQLWLQALIDAGYQFPDLQATRKKPKNEEIAVRSSQSEEEAAECRVDKKLTFWTSDLHDGSRLAVPSLLQSMGHKVVIAGIKEHASPYPYVFDRDGIEIYDNLSPVLRRYTTHSYRLNEKELKENFEFYKNDEKIASVDAFICSFPASMCELWLPFNKTIIYLPAHRYNLGRCTKEQWDRLNEHVTLLASSSAPRPRHIIAAGSVYDQEYMRHYLGIEPLPLYSFTGFYTNNIPYKPSRNEILLFSRTEIPGAAEQSHPKFQLVGIRSLYQHYKLSDLVNHRAIVYVPYSVMSYKLSELYSLSVPLFMPSIKSMQSTRYVSKDRSSLTSLYCNNMALDALMHPSPASIHPYSPNLNAPDDTEAEMYWLQFSDFFRFPHITYFDDAADLQRKLERADFRQIHELMEQENKRRKSNLIDVWCRATKVIQTGREVPKDYDKAIQELYGVNRLQAI